MYVCTHSISFEEDRKANSKQGYAPGSWSQVAVERTKPNGRIVGIDIIPAQPPKGVSTIQGNFLSVGVQEEVKKFMRDPNRGRPKPQPFSTYSGSDDGVDVLDPEQSYIDMERHADEETDMDLGGRRKSRRAQEEAEGKCIDVVLSDMSAPWEQTSGFWKRSLSDPYYRMMNTSGINFKDHAGSMVSSTPNANNRRSYVDVGYLGSLCSCPAVRARDVTFWRSLRVQVLSRSGGERAGSAVEENVWFCA